MAGTVVADTLQAASTSTLVLKNGVANTPPTIQDSAGTQIGTFCRAWVNFDGTTNTGGFCTIRGSFNVSSVADNGTGNYTVNFTNAMPDANYSVVIVADNNTSRNNNYAGTDTSNLPAAGSVRIISKAGSTPAGFDATTICASVFR